MYPPRIVIEIGLVRKMLNCSRAVAFWVALREKFRKSDAAVRAVLSRRVMDLAQSMEGYDVVPTIEKIQLVYSDMVVNW